MVRSNALVKVSGRDGGIASRLAQSARRRLDGVLGRAVGWDFDERLERVMAQQAAGRSDPFGLDLSWARYALLVAGLLYKQYFRVTVHGLQSVPTGRVLLIANHSGQVPIDGAVIAAAMFFDADPPRVVRSMVEKWAQTLPYVSTFFARCGQVVGVPENARLLLERDEALLVFPEGVKGVSKPFAERYRLKDFGLGFMRLALETGTPIVPIAVIGAEEQYVNLGNVQALARALGMPSFPIIPQLLLPGGQLPLPTKYHLYVGEPMRFRGDADDEDALVQAKVDTVRATIQAMINRGLKQRKHIFW